MCRPIVGTQKRVDSDRILVWCMFPTKSRWTTSHQSLGGTTIRRWYSRYVCTDPRPLHLPTVCGSGKGQRRAKKLGAPNTETKSDSHFKSWLLRTSGAEKARSVN